MEAPSQEIKNKGNDVQEKPKGGNNEILQGEQKEKIVEKETPPQDINNKDYDAQEKPKGGDEKEKIVENETPNEDSKNKAEDAQEKPKVEHKKKTPWSWRILGPSQQPGGPGHRPVKEPETG